MFILEKNLFFGCYKSGLVQCLPISMCYPWLGSDMNTVLFEYIY